MSTWSFTTRRPPTCSCLYRSHIPTTGSVTAGRRWANVGAMANRGAELNLNGTVFQTRDFTWSLNANVSYNANKITELYNGVDEYELSSTNMKYVVGHKVGEFYINRFAGVNPANGDALWYTKDGEITNELRDEDRVMTGKSMHSSAGWLTGG